MPANLHRLGRPLASGRPDDAALTILRPGDQLPPAGREPGQDAGRRRRRRGLEDRQGRHPGRRRRGRRRGVRPLAAPAAQHPRLHRQGRRGRPRADRRHAASPLLVLVGLGEQPDDRAAQAPRRTPRRGRRGPVDGQRRLGRAGPARRRRRAWSATCSRATCSAATRSPATSPRSPDQRAGTVTVLSPVARRQEAITRLRGGAGRRRPPSTRVRDWVNTPAGDLTPPLFADEITAGGQGHQGQGRRSSTRTQLAELGCGGLLGVGGGSSAPPRLVELRYSPADAGRPPRPGRQGHHLRLRRPEHQDRPAAWRR